MKNPPFELTGQIVSLVAEIAELVGRVSSTDRLSANPALRRSNRIKTVYGSLAIEQNTLLLSKWNPVFAWLPVESIVHDHQEAYYEAINVSNAAVSSTAVHRIHAGSNQNIAHRIGKHERWNERCSKR